MDKIDLLISLRGYKATKTPIANDKNCKNYFKWCNETIGVTTYEPISSSITIPPNTIVDLLETSVASGLSVFDLKKDTSASNKYHFTYKSGVAPEFALAKTLTFDNTSQINVVKNGDSLLFQSELGTPITTNIQIGDKVTLGNGFDILNQGTFIVTSKINSLFTISNPMGVNELVFVNDVDLSAYGVGPIYNNYLLSLKELEEEFGLFTIVDVTPTSLSFFSNKEVVELEDFNFQYNVYSSIKNMVYIEVDDKILLTTNAIDQMELKTMMSGVSPQPGVYMAYSPVNRVSLNNISDKSINVFYIIAE